MKTIPLTQNKVALVDDADFDFLNQFKWQAIRKSNLWRVKRTSSRLLGHKSVYMSKELLPTLGKQEIHHKDGDGLNNQKDNLIVCSRLENSRGFQNYRGGTSLFRGVAWDSQTRKWRAKISAEGKTICLGRFDREEEAALAYDCAAKRLFGEFAYPNFKI